MTYVGVFDLFKVGIGPSSSHTVGPMIAAHRFARHVQRASFLEQVASLRVELYGSLGSTGKGHGTGKAVMLGLSGFLPDSIDPDVIEPVLADIAHRGSLRLADQHRLPFETARHILYFRKALARHPNGMRFLALSARGEILLQKEYYSIGGGFLINCHGERLNGTPAAAEPPYPFHSGDELLRLTARTGMSIADIVMANESRYRPSTEVRAGVLAIWDAMAGAVARGCAQQGTLPGPMAVRRRAPALHRRLAAGGSDVLEILDWISLYAVAVNEENAAGGRVVTAPTNGAAGVVPAVLHYYVRFLQGTPDGIVTFLLTAAAIGALYKENASISGAEVGCQGEVGVACSMAAAGLAAVLGATPLQVENAAEIGMEHHLGLTCDPVGGRVQIPCIERNAMGAVKAVNAARMATAGDGLHYVSLDSVIRTMMQTGADMQTKYKETSRGGLAVNVTEC
ncbi:L-serine ammonia-lyase [Bordetella sp. BOR01]|uniref:L-serine ammonia-lyase n=1 Tax=Bordetella sp. BOR01 TaxID=2854779 RepID=UPI001C483B4C|nr:L-serine ammonia-lyase [Bordetella sp. BOR01]MBV7481812.1 L-serine ammonia-lyase [Bordetella sp. BOR01]